VIVLNLRLTLCELRLNLSVRCTGIVNVINHDLKYYMQRTIKAVAAYSSVAARDETAPSFLGQLSGPPVSSQTVAQSF
jgi:hypothetical protein